MADIILPQVPLLNTINNDTRILIEQYGDINRLPISNLNLDTLGGHPASYFASVASVNTVNNNLTTLINNTKSNLQTQISNIKIPEVPNIAWNYSITNGTAQPSNVKENLIWINTDQTITSVVFDNGTPHNPTEGMVWIITGSTSNAGLYLMTIDNMSIDRVYPVGVKQYISNQWVSKTGQIYQNNKWINFETYLLIDGIYQTDNTMSAYGVGTLKQVNGLLRSYMSENEYATYEFNKQINTRNYSKVEITVNGGSINYNIWFGFSAIKGAVPTSVNTNIFEIASVLIPRSGTTVTGGVYTIDLTNVNQESWFGFLTAGSSSSNTSTYGYGGIDITSIVFK